MCFTPDTRGTEYSNSVPAGAEFQNYHECEAQGIHFSLGPSALHIIHHEGRECNAYKDQRDRSLKILRYFLKPFLKGTILRSGE